MARQARSVIYEHNSSCYETRSEYGTIFSLHFRKKTMEVIRHENVRLKSRLDFPFAFFILGRPVWILWGFQHTASLHARGIL
jgi:hypothetical protein